VLLQERYAHIRARQAEVPADPSRVLEAGEGGSTQPTLKDKPDLMP
jgi:hypothetical protein